MSTPSHTIIDKDPWQELKSFTDARIGLGRCGTSLPLSESLHFKMAHARARDAVLQPMRTTEVQKELESIGIRNIALTSSVSDRSEYLTRPDKGRKLSAKSHQLLAERTEHVDLCLVVGDGLSSRAIHENCLPVLEAFFQMTQRSKLTSSPVCLVENARVAIADEIAPYFSAQIAVILIGERPGLSSPNSLGIYLTYKPTSGTTDESRNCISNIRVGGLSAQDGAQKLCYLIEKSLMQKISGVYLKDKMTKNYLPFSGTVDNMIV